MNRTSPIIYSLYMSSYAAVRLVHLMPKTDLCQELEEILLQQCSIIAGIIEGDRFLLKDIEAFIEECHQVAQQAEELDAIQE